MVRNTSPPSLRWLSAALSKSWFRRQLPETSGCSYLSSSAHQLCTGKRRLTCSSRQRSMSCGGETKGKRPQADGLGVGQRARRAKGQCHTDHKTGLGQFQDRSTDGGIQCYRLDGFEPGKRCDGGERVGFCLGPL